jgi:ATP-dependent Clp protease ATP-binding subunit ClpX
MLELMFEVPSLNIKEYVVTLDYAKAKVEKANMTALQMKNE